MSGLGIEGIMMEQEWLACTDPFAMLSALFGSLYGLADDVYLSRKHLLLLCACFSRLDRFIPHEARRWQEHAAQAAEGCYDKWGLHGEGEVADLMLGSAMEQAPDEPRGRLRALLDLWSWTDSPEWPADGGEGAWEAERKEQAALVRDIFGNPFRPVSVNPAWLAWNGGTVPKLARAIYDERAFNRLPLLADALEEAGCTDADILSHCRGPGPHALGCWVVDALIGKQ